MHSLGRVLAAFAVAVLAWCATLPAYAADRPTPQAMLRDWYYLMNELVRHTATYSPPVASRSFGYLGVTAFEAAAGGSDRLVSLVGQLHGLESVPAREAGAVYDETVIVSAAMSDAIVYLFRQYRSDGLARDQDRADEMAGSGPSMASPTMSWCAARPSARPWPPIHRLVADRWRRGHHQYGLPGKTGFAQGRGQMGADQPDPPAAAPAAARLGQQPHLCRALGRYLPDTGQPALQHRT